jgi:hypothetical protein
LSQLRLPFSALVISGLLFTTACGPQPEDLSARSATTEQRLEASADKKKCDYNDPNRSYAARSPEECAYTTFICVEGQTAFFDECGCGCETNP